jgi:WhiB family redox-sensing transcriptional regulator
MSTIAVVPGREAPDLPWFPDWTLKAACRGMFSRHESELFFDYGVDKRKIGRAKSVCRGCPVRLECLTENLEVPYGIFGGLTEGERSELCGGPRRAPRGANAWAYFAQFIEDGDPAHRRAGAR